jgi:predicted secreted protein
LIPGNSTPADFLNLLTHKKRIGLSIIYVAHSPKLILERITYYTTHYSVFDLNENIQDKNFMYKNLQIAKDLMKEHILMFGKGTYPKFPHIILKSVTEEFELRNK